MLLGQKQANVWYFGNYAGLDFNSGTPQPLLNSAMRQFEGSATISDAQGRLLFYTNGIDVWDKDHNIMPNGSGLTGNSSTAQIIIIPQPEHPDLYYIFYADYESGRNGLRYSIVDMRENGGKGDVVAGTKNTLLLQQASEKCAAVLHCNKTSVWLMTTNYATQQFYAYLITEVGIQPPVKSPCIIEYGSCCSSIKFSPNGRWLASVDNNYSGPADPQLYRFNNQTGVVTFYQTLPRNAQLRESFYGLSFSPDNSRLYLSSWYNIEVNTALFQYNMEAVDVASTKTLIHREPSSGSGVFPDPYCALQNGPDGRIYLARWNNSMDSIGVIEAPNALGMACRFNPTGVPLAGRKSIMGLPNFVESLFNQPASAVPCPEQDNSNPRVLLYRNNDQLTISSSQTGRLYLFDAIGRLFYVVNVNQPRQPIMPNQYMAPGVYFWAFEAGLSEVHRGKLHWAK